MLVRAYLRRVISSLSAGMFAGLSLIVAIGAQNAYVLRQGLLRQHVGVVVAVCALSDLVLITAGVAGIGVLVERAGWLLTLMTWLGVAFLVTYAGMSLLRALRSDALEAQRGRRHESRGRVAGRAVALTWLNPHVYLDTVVLLGAIAASQGSGGGRWWFAAGACLGSLVWFCSLGFGARSLSGLLARPRAWQVIDVLVAVTMLVIAGRLALG